MELLSNINMVFYLSAYLAGGIPFGYILAKQFANVNIKEAGSGNIGATNVLRVVKEKDPKLAKKLSIATLALDALKGFLVLLIGYFLNIPIETMWGVAILAVVGHCFSPFLFFEGGKGVATGVGVLAFMLPIHTLIAFIIWAVFAKLFKISSLASLFGLLSVLISIHFIDSSLNSIDSFAPIYIIAFIIFYKHIPNIIRLFSKKEGAV